MNTIHFLEKILDENKAIDVSSRASVGACHMPSEMMKEWIELMIEIGNEDRIIMNSFDPATSGSLLAYVNSHSSLSLVAQHHLKNKISIVDLAIAEVVLKAAVKFLTLHSNSPLHEFLLLHEIIDTYSFSEKDEALLTFQQEAYEKMSLFDRQVYFSFYEVLEFLLKNPVQPKPNIYLIKPYEERVKNEGLNGDPMVTPSKHTVQSVAMNTSIASTVSEITMSDIGERAFPLLCWLTTVTGGYPQLSPTTLFYIGVAIINSIVKAISPTKNQTPDFENREAEDFTARILEQYGSWSSDGERIENDEGQIENAAVQEYFEDPVEMIPRLALNRQLFPAFLNSSVQIDAPIFYLNDGSLDGVGATGGRPFNNRFDLADNTRLLTPLTPTPLPEGEGLQSLLPLRISGVPNRYQGPPEFMPIIFNNTSPLYLNSSDNNKQRIHITATLIMNNGIILIDLFGKKNKNHYHFVLVITAVFQHLFSNEVNDLCFESDSLMYHPAISSNFTNNNKAMLPVSKQRQNHHYHLENHSGELNIMQTLRKIGQRVSTVMLSSPNETGQHFPINTGDFDQNQPVVENNITPQVTWTQFADSDEESSRITYRDSVGEQSKTSVGVKSLIAAYNDVIEKQPESKEVPISHSPIALPVIASSTSASDKDELLGEQLGVKSDAGTDIISPIKMTTSFNDSTHVIDFEHFSEDEGDEVNSAHIPVPHVYPIPPNGDCAYSGFFVALMHGCLTNKIAQRSETTNMLIAMLTKINDDENLKLDLTSDIIEIFQQLFALYDAREYELLITVIVPALRACIADYAERIVHEIEQENSYNVIKSMIVYYNEHADETRLEYTQHFDEVRNENGKHNDEDEHSPHGTFIEFAVLEMLFSVRTTQTEMTALSGVLTHKKMTWPKFDIRNTGDHYAVHADKHETVAAFCDAVDKGWVLIRAANEVQKHERTLAMLRAEEDQKALEEQQSSELAQRLQAEEDARVEQARLLALENTCQRPVASTSAAIISSSVVELSAAQEIVVKITDAVKALSRNSVTEEQAADALRVLLLHKHEISSGERAAAISVKDNFSRLENACKLLIDIEEFQGQFYTMDDETGEQYLFGEKIDNTTTEAKYAIVNNGWNNLLKGRFGSSTEQTARAKDIEQSKQAILNGLPQKKAATSNTAPPLTPRQSVNRTLNLTTPNTSLDRTHDTDSVATDTSSQQELSTLTEAIEQFYLPTSTEKEKAQALRKLKNIALKLCDGKNGLNVRAQKAKEALESFSGRTVSKDNVYYHMDNVYRHFYTILQATVQATTKGTNAELRKMGCYEKALVATNDAKAMLLQLNQWEMTEPNLFPALTKAHDCMLKEWSLPEKTAVETLAEMDLSNALPHERASVKIASPGAHEVLSKASFVWEKLYKIGTDERSHGEERRHYEALAVSALKAIRLKLSNVQNSLYRSYPLSIEQKWLLVTAITDYDEQAKTKSPFYNAMQQFAIEENKSAKDLRDELYSPQVLHKLLESEKALSSTKQHLQEKMQGRLNRLLVKDADLAHSNSVTHTKSLHFFTTPPKASNVNAPNSEDVIVAGTPWEILVRNNFNSTYSAEINSAPLLEADIKQIFKIFDMQYHSLPKSETIKSSQCFLLLAKAFDAMNTLLLKEKEQANKFFSSSKIDPARFNAYIAPKEGLPAYAFAKYCEYQANKGVDYLYEHEDKFIRKYLPRLYDATSDELNKIKLPNRNGVSLRDYVAPTGLNLEPAVLEKTAIGLIYPRLDKKRRGLHAELLALETKLENGTLSQNDISEENLIVYKQICSCNPAAIPVDIATANKKIIKACSLRNRLDKIIRHVMTPAPTASHSSHMTPTKTK